MTAEEVAFARAEAEAERTGQELTMMFVLGLMKRAEMRRARRAFEAMLLEGLDGPRMPVNQEFWDSIRREATEGHAPEDSRP